MFLSFSHSSCCVRALFFSCGRRFPRFPVPVSYRLLAVSHPGGRRFSSFLHFPVRFPPCYRLPWGGALSLFVRSRLVSRLGIRCVGRGGCVCPVALACSMAWRCVGWRGVLSFRLAVRSLSMRGEGRFGWFFSYGIIGRVVRGGMGDLFASGRA